MGKLRDQILLEKLKEVVANLDTDKISMLSLEYILDRLNIDPEEIK